MYIHIYIYHISNNVTDAHGRVTGVLLELSSVD